jgi:Tol biopolymer transport system component
MDLHRFDSLTRNLSSRPTRRDTCEPAKETAMACHARGAPSFTTDSKQRKERLMKRYALRTRIALIVLAGLALGGGLLEAATPPAAAIVPGANGRIAFQSTRDGDFEIYTMSPRGEVGKHGKKAKKLTSNNVADVTPAWSPNGKKIAFASDRDGNLEIYVMNADGSNQTRLTTVAGIDNLPTWSPDGTKIAFVSNRDVGLPYFEIYVMNANGNNPTRLTTNTVTDYMPTWSPDGKRIAFAVSETGASAQVFSMAADGSNPRRLTKGSAYNWYPDWQPKP